MEISDELAQHLERNPHIDHVHFNKRGQHFFNAYSFRGKLYSRLREEWEELREDYEIVETWTREHLLRHHRKAVRSKFIFNVKHKFSEMSTPNLSVPSGTPVSGLNQPVDVNNNVLPDSAYLTGSCKYTVVAGPSGNPPGFTVAPGATEEDFVVTENVPGAASDGQINFDAQSAAGIQLPTSSGILVFTASTTTPPPVGTAVGSLFTFNPIASAVAAAVKK
jgi:hypothetical protein